MVWVGSGQIWIGLVLSNLVWNHSKNELNATSFVNVKPEPPRSTTVVRAPSLAELPQTCPGAETFQNEVNSTVLIHFEPEPTRSMPVARSGRSGLVWSGLVWSNLIWSGLVWSGLVWSCLVWSGLLGSGLVCLDLI